MDAILLGLEQGVEVALHRAKLWSKYAKDIMTYVEKRCNLEAEFAKSVAKLAQTMKSALKEEVIHLFLKHFYLESFILFQSFEKVFNNKQQIVGFLVLPTVPVDLHNSDGTRNRQQ